MEASGQFHAPAALPPGKSPGTYYTEGWVGPGDSLNAASKTKIPRRRRESNPDHPARSSTD